MISHSLCSRLDRAGHRIFARRPYQMCKGWKQIAHPALDAGDSPVQDVAKLQARLNGRPAARSCPGIRCQQLALQQRERPALRPPRRAASVPEQAVWRHSRRAPAGWRAGRRPPLRGPVGSLPLLEGAAVTSFPAGTSLRCTETPPEPRTCISRAVRHVTQALDYALHKHVWDSIPATGSI